jgi:hypothetical protein
MENHKTAMSEAILVTADDPRLSRLKFKKFLNSTERQAFEFDPGPGEPQKLDVLTPWGAQLTAKKGDFIVNDVDQPEDRWVVDREVFEQSYIFIRPGFCLKKAVVELVPLLDFTDGDPDRLVRIETLEGELTVRAGDFYLARGVKGEIWPYPIERIGSSLVPVEQALQAKQEK